MTILSILGTIGAGKSTLAQAISQLAHWNFYEEPVKENPFLEDFYKDQKRWGLSLQMYMLHYRFKQHLQMMHSSVNSVSDSSIFSDYCFASMLYESSTITKAEYQLYLNALENMKTFLTYPDLIVYIDCEPKRAIERINKRNRGFECGIPESYLAALNKQYEKMLNKLSIHTQILRISPFDDTESMMKEADIIINIAKGINNRVTQWDKVITEWKL